MPGLFNVQNALAALAVCEAVGVPEQYAFAGLMKARVPAGWRSMPTQTKRSA